MSEIDKDYQDPRRLHAGATEVQGAELPVGALVLRWTASDNVKLMDVRDDSTVVADFRYIRDGRDATTWVTKSAHEELANRIVWVVGEGSIENAAPGLSGRAR